MLKVKSLMKVLFVTVLCFGATTLSAQTVQTQTIEPTNNYRLGGGLLIDIGDGATFVGPHVKYFFTNQHAGEGALLFGNGVTYLQALYNYNMGIPDVQGLGWYVGAGPSIGFSDGSTAFNIIGTVGMEYKIAGAPIALSFDWRPRFFIVDSYTDFVAARFGLGVRYTFN